MIPSKWHNNILTTTKEVCFTIFYDCLVLFHHFFVLRPQGWGSQEAKKSKVCVDQRVIIFCVRFERSNNHDEEFLAYLQPFHSGETLLTLTIKCQAYFSH